MYSMIVLIFKCVDIENSDIDILLYLEFFVLFMECFYMAKKKIQSFANVLVQILSQ